jgi:long-chain fatty acid transport protein
MKLKLLNKSTSAILLASLCPAIFPSLAMANGYHFLHQSAEGMGTAYATNGTAANDISAMFSNPSSIIRFDGTRASGSFVLDLPKSRLYNAEATAPPPAAPNSYPVSGTPEEPRQPIDTAYGAASYFTYQINEDMVFGMYFGAPYAYVSEYPDTAVSRYTATTTSLFAYNLNPTLAYRVNEKLAIGGSINFQYYIAELETSVATNATPSVETDVTSNIKADDLSIGFSLGMEYQMSDETRIGMSYRSKIDHSFDGDVSFTGSEENLANGLNATNAAYNLGLTTLDSNVGFDISTPHMLQIGLLHQISEQSELYANANHFGWSAFKNTHISYDNGLPETVVDNNWNDSWMVAVGMGYQYSDKVKLRAGYAYDFTPTPADTVSPRAPNNDRWNVGLGLSYQYSDNLKLDFAYQYIKFEKVTIDLQGGNNEPRGTLKANLDLYANVFMMQMNYRF